MNDIKQKEDFNPNGIGLKNGNFIGLPFDEESANVILLPVPWDVTVSYGEGTALAPKAILDASSQLDLYDPDVPDAWKLGIFMASANEKILTERNLLRPKANEYISFLENDGEIASNSKMKATLNDINDACANLNSLVYSQSLSLLNANKLVGLIGGDHSVPLGYLKALSEKHPEFGILQIDAHHDLRKSYEGFSYSHASIFYNALQLKEITKLVQVGIRDYCHEEVKKAEAEKNRISVFYDKQLKENRFNGIHWDQQCAMIIDRLPEKVYISFDIDGLDPKLCPNTGTPVPGGLEFTEVIYLFNKIVESGRTVIGFDLCETGNQDWDANVGARISYKLCNLMGKSQGKI